MSLTFNISEFAEKLYAASITLLQEVESKDEEIRGFALMTNEGSMNIFPAVLLKSYLEEFPADEFFPAQWPEFENEARNFNEISEELAKFVLGSSQSISLARNEVLAAMTEALLNLREANVLPADAVLLVEVEDVESCDAFRVARIDRLNSKDVAEAIKSARGCGEVG